MKQVVQPIGGGPVQVIDAAPPEIGPTDVLVRTVASIISSGTERSVTGLAQSSLLGKARARPDLVREVVRRARTDGIAATFHKVQDRLGGLLPLGYSAAGIVERIGDQVDNVRPGQLVATGGASRANHAEYQSVPALLCTPVPDGVAATDAAFATIGSIALHGLRLADLQPGARVVVIGLGLVGQLAARMAVASGCEVAGIDVADLPLERARDAGVLALREDGADTTSTILDWSRGRGADAVIVTAADKSSAVMTRVPELCRDRADVVVVGDVGLDLDRTPLYERELTIRFARSYGPGRYERSYEEWAVDMPAGHVRWTEGRNQEAVLDLLAAERLRVDDLVTQRFPIDRADAAYTLIDQRAEPYLAVAIEYPEQARPRLAAPARRGDGRMGVGLIGTGAFATSVLVPALRNAGFDRFVGAASSSGVTAARAAERLGFERATSTTEELLDDPDVGVVVIATRHSSHAALAIEALRRGKHVWLEKPAAITLDELDELEAAYAASDAVLMVGFNRRWSPAVTAVREHFAGRAGPLVITYRVNAGQISDRHWYEDRREGGRLLGEACHFMDTCMAITDASTMRVVARTSTSSDGDNVVVAIEHDGGSLSAITYASGGTPGMPKERIEVLGRSRSAVIDNFSDTVLDGERVRTRGKGHAEGAVTFHEVVAGRREGDPGGSFAVTRAALEALASTLAV